MDTLASAVALDISYDSIAHVLRVTAQWPVAAARRLSVSASGGRGTHRTEVGILTAHADKSVGPHELGVAGLLTVLGDGDGGGKTSPTLFSFPSRHKSAGSQDDRSFSATFKKPTGLHPTLVLELSGTSAAEPPAEAAEQGDCSLHAYLTFPSVIFADRYQLADPLFLASRNLSALRWMSRPVDLEAPDYAAGLPWGSSLLVELEPPLSTPQGQQQQRQSSSWTAEIPLHLRYLAPHTGGHVGVEIPYPAVFWACAAEEGTKFPVNPFDRPHVGYDGLFGPRTLFWHVTPAPPAGAGGGAHTQLTSPLAVPVLDSSDRLAAWVPIGTAAAVLLGFGWVLLTLGIGWWRSRIDGGARTAVPGRETEKKGAAKRETRKTK